jgi:hypothetical protein
MEKKLDAPAPCSDCGRRIEPGEKVWIEKHKGQPDEIFCSMCFWGETGDTEPIPDDRIGKIIDNVHHLNERITKLEEGSGKIAAKAAAAKDVTPRIEALEREVRDIKHQMREILSLVKIMAKGPPIRTVSDELLALKRKGI